MALDSPTRFLGGGYFFMSQVPLYQDHQFLASIQPALERTRHIKPSRPDSGLGLQVQALDTFSGVPHLLGSGFRVACSVFKELGEGGYRGTSLKRNPSLPGPYSSKCLERYGVPRGGGYFL
jgi:hypothetical protein